MRVLNVNFSLDAVEGGGTAERTYQMSRWLVKAGQQCSVITLDLGLDETRRGGLAGVEVIALPCINRRFYLPRVDMRRINEEVARADFVHLMGHWTLINALVYKSVRRRGIPYAICPAGALRIYGRSAFLKHLYNRAVGNAIIRNAALHIAITEDDVALFHAYGVDDKSIVVIPNGIDPAAYATRDDAAIRHAIGVGDDPFILFVGRLNSIKGPDLLLSAFERIAPRNPRLRLVFAGPDDGMREGLERQAVTAGINQRVHFAGYIGNEQKSMAYHAASFLAIPSRHESMSIVVLEAGAAGTPVLLTDRCGVNEVADVGGGLVVGANVDGLADGLERLASLEGGAVAAMGVRLKEFVMARYTWDVIVRRYIELYSSLLVQKENK